MAKKKRNKKYSGRDAAQSAPVVKKFEVDGSFSFREWREENKLKILGWSLRVAIGLLAAGLGYIIYLWVT